MLMFFTLFNSDCWTIQSLQTETIQYFKKTPTFWLFFKLIVPNLVCKLFKGHKNNLPLLATVLHHGSWKEHQRATTGARSVIPSWQASTYIHASLPTFFFLFSWWSAEHARREPYLVADTDVHAVLGAVTAPERLERLAETLPVCGAELSQSHLNLAGRTWNSLPRGLPHTPNPQPMQAFAVNCNSWCQPLLQESGCSSVAGNYRGTRKFARFPQCFPVELVQQLV